MKETINKVENQGTSLLIVSNQSKLSKLQKAILIYLYQHKDDFRYGFRRRLTLVLAKKLNRLSDKSNCYNDCWSNVSPSFSVVVCNSLKSLVKRGLVIGVKNGNYGEKNTDVKLTPEGKIAAKELLGDEVE